MPHRREKSAEVVVAAEYRREGPNNEESASLMSRGKATHQISMQLELALVEGGEASRNQRSGEAGRAAQGKERSGNHRLLMEQVVARENALVAFQRVRRNKGSPGIDGMTVDELEPYLRDHWAALREQLLAGTYQPNVVRRHLIPKSGGGMRTLGIPTVLDRFVQQLVLQVLQPIFDPTFSEHSHGFRPGRRAHDAVRKAQQYIQTGKRWVVDVDLEKFFDRVNHDVLMGKLENRIGDRRMTGLIRRYLGAGVMADGVVMERHEGTPQGGPLSPLLANVLLDSVDKELERRGHAFVRYADDCNVYVRSRRAGERVLALLRKQYAALRLRINEEKSAVARPWHRKFLGYSFWVAKGQEYFKLAETPGIFAELDGWMHRRLRAMQLKQWKRGRTTHRELRARGLPEWLSTKGAGHGRRWWWAAGLAALHTALPGTYFDRLGVPRLAALTSTR